MRKTFFCFKGFICITLAFAILLGSSNVAWAEFYWPEGPSIQSESAIVMEINSGAVLYEKNMDMISYPASITKILTVMLALEYCEMEEIVTFSDDAIRYNQGDTSHIARDYGEQMTMKECLYAVMLESANECAYAVGEHVGVKLGGDYQTFIEMMNEKAAELGCTNTHFTNANGLPDENHWTSAHDMALISAEAYRNEDYRIIVGTRSYRIPPTNKHDEITPLNNHHGMISNYRTNKYLYEYCTGGKTGYTQASGHTLVSYAEKDGMTLVCVVMRSQNETRYTDTRTLFEYCFQNFEKVSIGKNGNTEKDADDNLGIMQDYSSFVKLDEGAQIILPITADVSDVQMTLVNSDLPKGVIAQLDYYYGGHRVGCVDVVLSESTIEDNYFEQQDNDTGKKVVLIKPYIVFLILLAIVVLVIIILIIKRVYDNFYVIRHDMEVKKQRRSRFRPVSSKKKKWRRRDRMFK